jgi:hypothetical protein
VSHRPIRPLAIVGLLAFGDYLLWNWSLSANHDILALVSGMMLIPLLIAFAWLLFLFLARLIAHTAQRPRAGAMARAGGDVRARRPTTGTTPTGGQPPAPRGGPASTAVDRAPAHSPTASPSSKIAA